MNRRSLLALLAVLIASPASADCLRWAYDANGNKSCVKLDNSSPQSSVSSVIGIGGGAVNSGLVAPTPDCKPDEETVMRSNYHWACAKNVRER